MSKMKIWIDTDAGIDDAIALLNAGKLPSLEIVGCSTVSGNVHVDKTFINTRNVLSLMGREDVPVYKGADRPLIKEYRSAEAFHGENGLGGAVIPASKAPVETEKGWDALYEKAKELNGEMILVAVGPLTNVALAITAHPDITKYLKKIAIMGGALNGGNVTPCAEFNIYCDPHAAEVVFKSGIEIIMCGLDVTTRARLNAEDIDEIHGYGNKAADLLYDSTLNVKEFNMKGNKKGILLHDSCPFFFLDDPELFTSYPCGIYVETQGGITMGKTVCDLYSDHKWEDRHCTIVMDVDNDRLIARVKEIYRQHE